MIDETKFSTDNINSLLQKNKLATKEKTKVEIKSECNALSNALTKLINEDYYESIAKNNEPDELYSNKIFYFNFITNDKYARVYCGIDFPKLSKKLSNKMNANITITINPEYRNDRYRRITLYKRNNWFG